MLINRVGTYLIFVGLALIGLFILSDMAAVPTCSLLVIGAVSLALGIFFWFKDPADASQPTGRFSIFKRLSQKKEKKQGKK